MLKRLVLLAAVAALAAPALASADTLLAADTKAQDLTALGGTRAWITGAFGAQRLMIQTGSAAAGPVVGAVPAKLYQGIDLGLDSHGKPVLTYLRCLTSLRVCRPMADDLQGHRATLRGLAPAGCSVSSAPAIWRSRVAYGVGCAHSSRSGLYVRTGTGRPRRLRLPADAVRFQIDRITRVDLRGSRVGAVAADVYEYAFSESVSGHALRSYMAAASEGDSDEHVAGLAVGPAGDLWTLTDAEHAGDPNIAVIDHQIPGCLEYETIANPAGPDEESGYLATGLAADGALLDLITPGGVVQHAFAPDTVSACGSSSSAPASAG